MQENSHLRFLENLDRINLAIQGTNNLEKMMIDVLDTLLSVFECDRAWLVYPCDPEASTWQVPMERTRPEYPGVLPIGVELPLDPAGAAVYKILRESSGPIQFHKKSKHKIPTEMATGFGVQSFIATAIYPKVGKPWSFGLHQCSHPREWTKEEESLFREIGRRLSDGLSTLLTLQDLRKNEQKYRLIAENTADTIGLYNLNLKPTFISPSVLKLRGYTVDEALNQSLDQVLTPESFQKAQEVLSRNLELEKINTADTERVEIFELEEYCKDGSTIWVELTAKFIRDDNGGPTGILTVTRDITERKQTEDNLHASEKRFSKAFHLSPMGMAIFRSSDGRFVYVNDTFVQISGYSREEIIGRNAIELQLYANPKERDSILKKLREQGKLDKFEFKTRTKSGEIRDGLSATTEIDLDGEKHYLSLIMDITDRKQAENSLKLYTERLEKAEEDANLGSWEFDAVTQKGWWSKQMYKFFGFDNYEEVPSDEEYLNRIHPDDRQWIQNVMTIMSHGELPEIKIFRTNPEFGRIRYLEPTVNIVRDTNGNILKITGTSRDITQRVLYEETLKKLNRELKAISNCNQTLLRVEDEQTLLNEVCRIICEEAGYRFTWVGFAEQDKAKSIVPAAWAGFEDGYLSNVKLSWSEKNEHDQRPAAIAIRSGETVYSQDFSKDSRMIPWLDGLLKRGYKSGIALPLKDEKKKTFGVLLIYSSEVDNITPDEIILMEELAGDLAYGISALRIRTEHKKAEMQIRSSEQLFRALVENSPDFIARYDKEFRRIYVNPAIQKLFGKSEEDVLSKTPADQSPLYAPEVYIEQLRQVIDTSSERTIEMPFRTTQGEMHWGHMRFVPE